MIQMKDMEKHIGKVVVAHVNGKKVPVRGIGIEPEKKVFTCEVLIGEHKGRRMSGVYAEENLVRVYEEDEVILALLGYKEENPDEEK